MPPRVREPIQTYLSREERVTLDRLAADLNLSRAEVLRRGLELMARETGGEEEDPLDSFVGGFDVPGAPRDLSVNHDKYLARGAGKPRRRRRSRSS